MILSFPFLTASFDADARAYINTSGATDRAAINHFVKGIKRLGLYSSMVCWPLRSSQNAGTGSTAYSLGGLGTYNGTLINGPTWGADGINRNASNAIVQITSDATLRSVLSVLFAFKSSVTSDNQIGVALSSPISGENYFQTVFNNDSVKQSYFSTTRGGINANSTIQNATGRELLWNFAGGAMASTQNQAVFNNTLGALQTGLTFRNPAGSFNFVIGAVSTTTNTNARGDYSFALLSTQQFSGAQITDIYTLYKSTLGQGLGLP
jgi:hypothetical protein